MAAKNRARRIALISVVVGLALAGLAVLLFRDALSSEWQLVKFRYGSDGERDAIALELGRRGYQRAIPYLMRALDDESERIVVPEFFGLRAATRQLVTDSAILKALFEMREFATAPLEALVENPSGAQKKWNRGESATVTVSSAALVLKTSEFLTYEPDRSALEARWMRGLEVE